MNEYIPTPSQTDIDQLDGTAGKGLFIFSSSVEICGILLKSALATDWAVSIVVPDPTIVAPPSLSSYRWYTILGETGPILDGHFSMPAGGRIVVSTASVADSNPTAQIIFQPKR